MIAKRRTKGDTRFEGGGGRLYLGEGDFVAVDADRPMNGPKWVANGAMSGM
jgi:hypothetical protein